MTCLHRATYNQRTDIIEILENCFGEETLRIEVGQIRDIKGRKPKDYARNELTEAYKERWSCPAKKGR